MVKLSICTVYLSVYSLHNVTVLPSLKRKTLLSLCIYYSLSPGLNYSSQHKSPLLPAVLHILYSCLLCYTYCISCSTGLSNCFHISLFIYLIINQLPCDSLRSGKHQIQQFIYIYLTLNLSIHACYHEHLLKVNLLFSY